LSGRLSAANLKVTPQRLAIYAELLQNRDHPSPETLYQAVKDDLPRMSLATVYKTLDAFESAGLVSQLALANERKRYDANLDPHHHLICTGCRRIIDFNDDALSSLKIENTGHDFRPEEIKVQIMGVCVDCQANASTPNSIAVDELSTAIETTEE